MDVIKYILNILNLLIYFSMIILMISVVGYISFYKKYKLEELNIKKYIADITTNVKDEDISILDNLIAEYQAYYLLLNNKFNGYINEEQEKEMCLYIANSIANDISSSTINRLSKIYNPDSLSDIISRKVYISVSSYVSENNKPEEE